MGFGGMVDGRLEGWRLAKASTLWSRRGMVRRNHAVSDL